MKKAIKKNNIKGKILEFVNSPLFPFFVLFVVMIIIHLFTYSNSDDSFFRIQLDKYNLFDYLVMRYNTWSSRFVIEILFVTVTRIPLWIWMIIDSLIFTSIGVLISKLFNDKNNKSLNWLLVLLILIYPFNDMASSGYMCTTIAYVWPTACLLYIMNILKKIINNDKVKVIEYIFMYLLSTLVLCFEQPLCLLFGFTCVILGYLIFSKKFSFKKDVHLLIMLLLTIIMFIIEFTCPGNTARYNAEIINWFPEYSEYGLFSKLYLGIVPTFEILIRNKIVILLFSVALTFAVFNKTSNKLFRLLAIMQSGFFLVFGIFNKVLISIYPSIERFFTLIELRTVFREEDRNFLNLSPLIIILLLVVILSILIIVVFRKKLLPLIIFGASLASRLMMGFSPTIFGSAERTAFFMYIGIIILTFMLLKFIYDNYYKNNSKKLEVINYLFASVAFINVMNIIYTLCIVKGSLGL